MTLLHPAIAVAGALAVAIPIIIHLTIFYSDEVLVPLGFIALVKALARAFDALTDPLMGWITDRTRTSTAVSGETPWTMHCHSAPAWPWRRRHSARGETSLLSFLRVLHCASSCGSEDAVILT